MPVAAAAEPAPAEVAPSRAPVDREAVDSAITAERLRQDVEFLASDAMAGRATPSPELDAAAEFIAERFGELGLSSPASVTDYRQTFECGGMFSAGLAANVVGVVPGSDPTAGMVLVSAHYDHIGSHIEVGPSRPDPVFNGANDNASGVASMLAIAKVVAALDPAPVRGVVFVAFCGEEVGLVGSKHFAAEPPVPLSDIVAGFNLEMLGRADAAHPRRAWVTGRELSTFADVLRAANDGRGVTFVSSRDVGPAEAETFDRSDNHPLARQGVVAHSISTGTIDRYYHAADDEPATLDYAAMETLVRAVARGVVRLADGAPPPVWTDAGRQAGYGADPG